MCTKNNPLQFLLGIMQICTDRYSTFLHCYVLYITHIDIEACQMIIKKRSNKT